jgi:hypothetical protein
MEKAVTGYVEIRSENAAEIVKFVQAHISDFEDKRIEIAGSEARGYVAQMYVSCEPT